MRRLPFLFLLLLIPILAGCASFAHGVVAERAAVLAAWDDVQTRADAAGGQIAGVVVAPFHAAGRFLLVVLLAGLSGGAHAPLDALEALGLRAPCPECAAQRSATPTRPAR